MGDGGWGLIYGSRLVANGLRGFFCFFGGLWVVVAGFSGSWCGASTMAKIDRWGLLVVGSKGFGWRVTFWWLGSWCGLAEMSWRDFEGGVVAGFLVVENIWWKNFFFFLVLDWLAMMLQTDRCLLWYQNWRRTIRTKLKQWKNKGIWLRNQHLGLAWSQHQARKPLGVST